MFHEICPEAIVGQILNLAIADNNETWKAIILVCKVWNRLAFKYLYELPFEKCISIHYSIEAKEKFCKPEDFLDKCIGLKKTTLELYDLDSCQDSLLAHINLVKKHPWVLDEVCIKAFMPKQPEKFIQVFLDPSYKHLHCKDYHV